MPVPRFLVPVAAALVIAGLAVALFIAMGNKPRTQAATHPDGADDISDLMAIKAEAESLAIAGKLQEAHERYQQLFVKAQGRKIGSLNWDILERAKDAQDRIYATLLVQHESKAMAAARGSTTRPRGDYPAWSMADARAAAATRGAATQGAVARAAAVTTTPTTGVSPQPTTRMVLPPLPQPKRVQVVRTSPDPDGFVDQHIGIALQDSTALLAAQFKDGEIEQGKEISEMYRYGLNALCAYALLSAGQATRDAQFAPASPFMRAALDKMKSHPLHTDRTKPQAPVTYARSLRAAALALANRPEDREALKEDVEWLIKAQVNGAYTYDDRFAGLPVVPGENEVPNEKGDAGPTGGSVALDVPPRQTSGQVTAPPQGSPNVGVVGVGGGKGPKVTVRPPPRPVRPRVQPRPRPKVTYTLRKVAAGRPLGPVADGRHGPGGIELDRPQTLRIPNTPPPPSIYDGPQDMTDPAEFFRWDNSNSQYGLLGVWAGAEVGIEVPDAYWAAVQQHWLSCQLQDAQWPYRADRPGGYLAMNCAGLVSMLITHDYLDAPKVAASTIDPNRRPTPPEQSIAAALAWLERGENAVTVTGNRTIYLGYNLHALSRVGLATGYKYLGAHDWYKDLAKKVVLSQWPNGSWGKFDQPVPDTLVDTAYTMLFLARGRHPVMMNKLRLDSATIVKDGEEKANPLAGPATVKKDRGAWNNRPRDVANLAKFASYELERPVNWQVVSIDADPEDWSDAPILYVASHAALKLSPEEITKIRAFVDAGGMLLTQADANSGAFNTYAENTLAKQLFPDYPLKDLPADHEIYSVNYIVAKQNRPRLKGVSNTSRLLWVHSPTDLGLAWQTRATKSKREAFELGVNLFVYAAGKTDLRNRIDARAVPPTTAQPSMTIPLARLKYDGNWNPEPMAFPRFARYFQWETSLGLDVKEVEIAKLGQEFRFAHLAGTAPFNPTEAEIAVLKQFVEGGGTLICDPVGGSGSSFADTLQGTILPKAFPGAKFEALDARHPLLNATFEGMEDVYKTRMRAYAVQKLGATPPPIRVAAVGKGRVIYLPLDLTSGLLGTNTWSILGYAPTESQAILKNIILYTLENP